SFLLAVLKKRKEPRKQLSYDTQVTDSLVEVEHDLREKVRILYNDQEIADLYPVACEVQNTGNTIVKNQLVRFEFPEGSRIVDMSFDPQPEPELIISEEPQADSKLHEKRFRLGHLEKGQYVGFRFLVSSPSPAHVRLHPFNEEGDVEFVPRKLARAEDERYAFTRFITLWILFLLLPRALSVIPFELGQMAAGVVRLALLVAIWPFLRPSASIISRCILRLAADQAPAGWDIERINAENVILGSSQSVINKPRDSNDPNDRSA
ncbi:MAG: hypothetical protein HGA43_12265, partial [Nitrospirae bacterium]|nr:hypothetical protein [Nitrospirota bacterium]